MPLRRRVIHVAVMLGLLAAFTGGPAPVSATPAAAPAVGFVVNVLTDAADAAPGNGVCETATEDECSLRAALQEANALAGPDAITFSITGIITFTSASPTITETVTIVGPGADLLTLDADHTGSVLRFIPTTMADYHLEGLTLTGGSATDGGGVFAGGLSALVISDTVLTGNTALSGGGLAVFSSLTHVQLINSQVITNGAGTRGGGVRNSGPLEITNSRIEGNWVEPVALGAAAAPQGVSLSYAGGGLYADGPLTMTNSLVLGNSALAPTCAQAVDPAGACLSGSSPAVIGAGPFGAGVALVNARAVLRASLIGGNYFGPACGSCAAAPAGVITGHGGGIYSYLGDLALIDTELLDNSAHEGGGLYTLLGDVVLLRARVIDNTANLAGGGVVSEDGPLGIEGSLFADNRANTGPAGGLRFINGALVIRNSEFDDNSAALGGGGLSIFDALATIDDTAIHHNRAGYTPFAADVALEPQGIAGPGGGLLLSLSVVVMRQSAIYSNTADAGGGLSNSGTLTLTNVTLSGNSATGSGGGLYLSPPPVSVAGGSPTIQAYLRHVTLAGNIADSDNTTTGNGGGVFAGAGQTVTFSSSIVADNGDLGGEAAACGGPGTFVSAGYNLWTTTANCALAATTGDQFNVAAGLVPLQDNGGPTLTHGLRLDSLALDAADQTNCANTDQRGALRPFGAGCDIGAFEAAGLYLPLVLR